MNFASLDLDVALMGLAASLAALATTLRYFRHSRRKCAGIVWLFILLAVFAITMSVGVSVVNTFLGKIPSWTSDMFGFFAEVALAIGFVRLYGAELAEEHARQDALQQRIQQVESLSSAALELSADLQLGVVLRDLVQRTMELSGADVAGVNLVGRASTPPEVEAVFVRRGEGPPKIRKFRPGELTRLIIDTAQPQVIENIPKHLLDQSLTGLESIAFFSMLCEQKVTAVLFTGFRKKHDFSENDRCLLSTLARHASLAIHNAALYKKVEELSLTDSLTGLANRRHFDNGLGVELARARRYGKPLSVIIFDLDRFKAINDHYGHPAGDLALTAVAEGLARSCREADITARVGGEEFELILPETEAAGAAQMTERVCEQMASKPIVWEGQTLMVSLSAGVTREIGESLPADATTLFRRADQTLYRAKKCGRDQVVLGYMTSGGKR